VTIIEKMVLNLETRGMIEKIIDGQIQVAKENIRVYRIPEIKSKFHIKDEADFVLGISLGNIMTKFETSYIIMNMGMAPNYEEQREAASIIIKRLSEIRDTIFKST